MKDFANMARSLRESEKEVERQENVRRQFMMDVAHEMRYTIDNHEWIARWLGNTIWCQSLVGRSLELISSETHRLIGLVSENLDYEDSFRTKLY